MNDDELTQWGRRAWGALEAIHVPGYFSRECREAYTAIGLHPALAYFPVRSAAMGAVPAEVVEATFYGFSARLIRQVIPDCWATTPPEQVLAARHTGVAATLHRVLDPALADASPDLLDEAVALARRACEGLSSPGRPLYAGHASLPWPEEPLMQLWHAATLVREFRGDGHLAALVAAGLGPIESMLTYGLVGTGVPLRFLRRSRGWTDAEWDAAAQSLRARGLVADVEGGVDGTGLALTPDGQQLRAELETTTDRVALAGWRHLGSEGTHRLAELVRPLSRAVAASGVLKPVTRQP